MIVSGRSPIPARAAKAKVGNFDTSWFGPETRRVGRLRWWPALSRPRISSFFSATFADPKRVSASSTSRVGGLSVIDRNTEAGEALTVISGSWTVSVTTSSRRDLPHRFAGPTTARRGACCHAVCRCVAATHSVTAVSASSLGSTTYRRNWARKSESTSSPWEGSAGSGREAADWPGTATCGQAG